MKAGTGQLRVGTSGYIYEHWKRVFYPEDLPKSRWFEYYASRFDTVEINFTFYRMPDAGVFKSWREAAPADFLYALKFSRYGTHQKRLRDPDALIDYFLERARRLRSTLGPVLVQLPPNWKVDVERLSGFLRELPRSPRWAVEFRDRSWLCQPVYELLERHRVALCLHDKFADHPERVTTDFLYLRFHGVPFRNNYPAPTLAAYARRLRDYLAQGYDVYAYFNNDAKGHAIRNALDLRRYAEEARPRAIAVSEQGSKLWNQKAKRSGRTGSVSQARTAG